MDLSDYRAQLDAIDDQMALLFRRRMAVVKDVADYKMAHHTPVLAPTRERDILSRVTGLAGPELEAYTRLLWSTILELSRDYQADRLSAGGSPLCRKILEAAGATDGFPSRAAVACPGPEGGCSQIACARLFALPRIVYCSRLEDVFQAVEAGVCRYGVLPIESGSAGSATEVYGLLEQYGCKIVRSLKLQAERCPQGNSGTALAGVKEAAAHEQALNQCGSFQRDRPCNAAVFSGGYMRFVCVSRSLEVFDGADRITFAVSAGQRPGALYALIAKFAVRGLNIRRLESRSIPGNDLAFRLYFDVEAPVRGKDAQTLLSQLEKDDFFTFLGAYSEVS